MAAIAHRENGTSVRLERQLIPAFLMTSGMLSLGKTSGKTDQCQVSPVEVTSQEEAFPCPLPRQTERKDTELQQDGWRQAEGETSISGK